MPNAVELVKKAAVEAVDETQPSGIFFGTVTGVSPLEIELESHLPLTADHLILSTLVQDFWVDETVDHLTENRAGGSGEAAYASHNHEYKGRKQFLIHLALKEGEKVILIRIQGGQRYIVLDRVRNAL